MEKISKRVFSELKKIKKGEVISYKQLAIKCNTSPRAVAKILSTNKNPIIIPCHRVIKNNMEIGGYTYNGKQDINKKIQLLKKEGIKIKSNKIIL
jgi:methylated-DNA-[protein]-cysteine S-methyltransferase